MLEEVKAIQGINHNDFDNMINDWIAAAKLDLINVGIANALVNATNPDSLIKATIISYVLSQLDVENSERYFNSYSLQKDALRHTDTYITPHVVW